MVETSSLITHPVTDDERLVHHKLDLLLRTGCILVENAADTSRIIRTMKRVAMYLCIPIENLHIYVNYNMLMVNLSDVEKSYTKFQRVDKHGVNLDAIREISHLSWDSIRKNLTLEEYERQLTEIHQRKRNYTPLAGSHWRRTGVRRLLHPVRLRLDGILLCLHCSHIGLASAYVPQFQGLQWIFQHRLGSFCIHAIGMALRLDFHPVWHFLLGVLHPMASAFGLRLVHRSRRTAHQFRKRHAFRLYPGGYHPSHQHAAYAFCHGFRHSLCHPVLWHRQLCPRLVHDSPSHL